MPNPGLPMKYFENPSADLPKKQIRTENPR